MNQKTDNRKTDNKPLSENSPLSGQAPTATEGGNGSDEPVDNKADDVANGSDKAPKTGSDTTRPDPTRFGDWEKNGRCIDF